MLPIWLSQWSRTSCACRSRSEANSPSADSSPSMQNSRGFELRPPMLSCTFKSRRIREDQPCLFQTEDKQATLRFQKKTFICPVQVYSGCRTTWEADHAFFFQLARCSSRFNLHPAFRFSTFCRTQFNLHLAFTLSTWTQIQIQSTPCVHIVNVLPDTIPISASFGRKRRREALLIQSTRHTEKRRIRLMRKSTWRLLTRTRTQEQETMQGLLPSTSGGKASRTIRA